MRVIAGEARGRTLKPVPGNNTRPTTDKVKEAIFSMIGPYFDGGTALDLFAGTGGLGIEAWSRGMERVIFVDRERLSIGIIRQNVKAAGMNDEAAEIYCNDAERALKALAKRRTKLRLVFLDPPYKLTTMNQLMDKLVEDEMLEPEALVVVEHDVSLRYPEQMKHFDQMKYATYGDTSVTIYQYKLTDSIGGSEDDDNK